MASLPSLGSSLVTYTPDVDESAASDTAHMTRRAGWRRPVWRPPSWAQRGIKERALPAHLLCGALGCLQHTAGEIPPIFFLGGTLLPT